MPGSTQARGGRGGFLEEVAPSGQQHLRKEGLPPRTLLWAELYPPDQIPGHPPPPH